MVRSLVDMRCLTLHCSAMNYTFGLGVNYVDVGIFSGVSEPEHFLVSINRLTRITRHSTLRNVTCYLEQDCSLRVYDDTTCGLVSQLPNSHHLNRGMICAELRQLTFS